MNKLCKICNNKSSSTKITLRDGSEDNLYTCNDCGFSFLDAKYQSLLEEDKFEDARLGSAGLKIPEISEDFQNGLNQSKKYLNEYIGKNSLNDQILEIGCSWGYFLSLLKDEGFNVCGLEINKTRATYVKDNLGISCFTSLEDLEIKKYSFDKIFLFYTLEYIEFPLDYLNRVLNLLNNNGKVVIITPNLKDVLKDVWFNKGFQVFFFEKQAVSYFSQESLETLFSKLSSKVSYTIDLRQGYSIFNHLSWFFSQKPVWTGSVGEDNHLEEIITSLNRESDLYPELRSFLENLDFSYKNILQGHGYGNQIHVTLSK